MNFSELINSITPEIYQNLKRAVEIGKWPNGEKLTDEQREHSMQAIIAFEQKHLPPESRTGYVPPKDACASTKPNDGSEKIKWQ